MVKKVFKKERKKASRSFIYKSLKLESTQMTIVIKMDQKMWHIIQSNKKEWTIDTHDKRDGSLRCNVKQKKKKPVTEEYILYDDSINMRLKDRQN